MPSKLSPQQCQSLFSAKKEKNSISLSSAESAKRVVRLIIHTVNSRYLEFQGTL